MLWVAVGGGTPADQTKETNSMRKTIPVADVVEKANRLLANTNERLTPEFRKGVAAVVESVLFGTGTYAGYNYLGWAVEGGVEQWRRDGEPRDNTPYLGDQTRRFYYLDRRLRDSATSEPAAHTQQMVLDEDRDRSFPHALKAVGGEGGANG
jgi:hypothetical protein